MAQIVFSHANGFPAGTYRVLFEAWQAAGHTVSAVPMYGHDPAYPVTSNWPRLRDQLLDFIDHQSAAPAFLVGHSLGGLLSLLAACRRPEVARGVVLLDAPVISGWRAHSLHVAKRTGLVHRVSPGRVSRRRRHHWPDAQAMHAHFAGKAAFALWDPRLLADYVSAGSAPAEGGGVRLAFDRMVETRIYDSLPHHLGALLRRHPPRCPVACVAGTRSAEMRMVGLAPTRALVRERYLTIEGTHLFPMERPDDTAQAVLRLIDTMA